MIVQIEDGRKIEVNDGLTPDQLDEVISHAAGDKPMQGLSKANDILPGGDAMEQVAKGATFGLVDEIGSGLGATKRALDKGTLKDWSEDYNVGLESLRANEKEFEQENPLASVGLQTLGGLGTAAVGGATNAGKSLAQNMAKGGLGERITKGMAVGGLTGLAQGFGTGEGGATERLKSAGDNIALGTIVGGAIPAVGAGLKKAFTKEVIPNADKLREAGSNLYKSAEQKGGVLKSEFTDKFVDDIEKLKPQTDIGKIVGGDSPFTKAIEKIGGIRGKQMSLDAAQELDELLGDAIDGFTDAGRLTKQGKKLLDVQTQLRNAIDDADESMIIGGKEGFNELKQARKVWSASRRLADVERIIQRAEMTDNPATSIKTGFRTLLSNPNRAKGFAKDELKAMEKAANSGIISDTLRIFGSRLLPIISTASGAGGLGGVAATSAASLASRSGATAVQVGKAKNISDIIARKGAEAAGMPIENTPRSALIQKMMESKLPGMIAPANSNREALMRFMMGGR